MVSDRELYGSRNSSHRDRAVEQTLSDVLRQLETVGKDSGTATIRRIGLRGLLLTKAGLALKVGEKMALERHFPDVIVAVPTSDKGWSAPEEDWPARVFVSPEAFELAGLRNPHVIFSASMNENDDK